MVLIPRRLHSSTYLGILPQYLGLAQDGQTHVYKDKTKKSLYGG